MTMWMPDLEVGRPRYLAIADAIARDVAAGSLPEGARLPTHRKLADALGVTVGTVTRGYAEAERRGLTTGEVGRGTFVRQADVEDFGWADAATREETRASVIDMSLACPWVPPDGTEGRMLADSLSRIAQSRSLDELMVYYPSSALLRHRTVAADWLRRLGVDVTPEQVVVTNGAQHAMTVILAALVRPGGTLVTEELTYPGLKSVAQMLGLQVRGVPLDGEGIVPDALDEACTESPAQALYCVPTIQNPTGATMSETRRRDIAQVARKHGLIIVEDEIHVALSDERLPPIASFAPERTLHITTLCKWVTFGLRIGFVAAPDRAVERIRSGVRSSLWMPAPLMAELATRWIVDGTAEKLAAHKRAELEARHAIVHDVLAGHRIDSDPRSLHLWVHLPEPLRSDECVARARQRGVLIAGAEAFTVGRDVPHAVRVSIASVPRREDVRRGLEVLAAILDGASDPVAQIL
jgi:DNA-binding transcriptional MocR family regulator